MKSTRNRKEQEKRFMKKALISVSLAVLLLLECGFFWLKYRDSLYMRWAENAAATGNYERAISLAKTAEEYGAENGENKIRFQRATELYNAGSFDEAETAFSELGEFQTASQMVLACRYGKAAILEAEGSFQEAADMFTTATGYEDALTRRDYCVYAMAEEARAKGDYTTASKLFSDAAAVEDAPERAKECAYLQAETLYNAGSTNEAFTAFLALDDYKDAYSRAVTIAKALTGETDEQAALSAAGGYTPEQWAAKEAFRNKWAALKRDTMAAGWNHAVAVTASGTVLSAGDDTYGQCQTAGWTDIVAVKAGARHTVGLKADGTVVATGDNTHGQCDVGEWTDITAIAVGDWDTYGLTAEGNVLHCGFGEDSTVTAWNGIIALAADSNACAAVRSGGSVLVSYASADCSGWQAVTETAVGIGWVAGITDEGELQAFGFTAPEWENILALDASTTVLGGLTSEDRVETLAMMPHGQALATAIAEEENVENFCISATWAVLKKTDGTYVCVGSDTSKPDVSGWNG